MAGVCKKAKNKTCLLEFLYDRSIIMKNQRVFQEVIHAVKQTPKSFVTQK